MIQVAIIRVKLAGLRNSTKTLQLNVSREYPFARETLFKSFKKGALFQQNFGDRMIQSRVVRQVSMSGVQNPKIISSNPALV